MNPSVTEFDRYRTTAVRNCILALIGLGAVIAWRAYVDGYPAVAAAILVSSASGLWILIRMRRGASHRWAGASGICVLYALIVYANTTTGGFHDTNFAWFSIVPITAALVLGTRAALLWGAVVMATSFAFWTLSEQGVVIPHWIPEADRPEQALFNRITQTLALVVMAVAFVRGHDRVSRALVDANAALTRETTRVQLLQYAAVAANEAESVGEATANCARRVATVADWPLAMHWAPDETGRWRFESVWTTAPPERFEAIVAQSRSLHFASGEHDLGQIVATGRPMTATANRIAGSPRGDVALAAGLRSVVAIPILSQGHAVGLLEFWRESDAPVDGATLDVLAEVGQQLGHVAHRIALEEGVRRAQKLESVAQLAAGIAHEINNPMTYVRSNLGTLARELDGLREAYDKPERGDEVATRFADCEELVADAMEGADRTVSIVRDIQHFAHNGKASNSEVSLAEVVRSALRLCARRLDDSITIGTTLDDDATVLGSASQLQQVVVNLIVNATQAMPEGGRIDLTLSPAGECFELVVGDEGPGISQEARERIFDPFFTTKEVGEGMGLGLYVSHGIVHAHGGEIQIEARHPRGTSFVVRLPAADTA